MSGFGFLGLIGKFGLWLAIDNDNNLKNCLNQDLQNLWTKKDCCFSKNCLDSK
jgi:hypothetical protein